MSAAPGGRLGRTRLAARAGAEAAVRRPRGSRAGVPAPSVDLATCSRCGLCVAVCPSGAVGVRWAPDGAWLPVIDRGRCIRCDDCALVCPESAVEIPFLVVEESSDE